MAQEERKKNHGRREQGRSAEETGRASETRRRRRRGSAAWTLLYVAFVIGVSTILAAVGWVAANDVLALNKPDKSAIITISDGESFGQVVNDLKDKGLIEFKVVFHLYSALSHAEQKIAPGTYELNTAMDYRAIVANLGAKSASRQKVTVTIPEGFTVAQIFQRLEEKGVSTVAKLDDTAANHDYDFSFLKDNALGDASRLEGYLFPDTYEFYMGEDSKTAINKMLLNFDRKYSDEMRSQTEQEGYTIRDIVIIASLIEKETDGTDQKLIASVIYNRLNNPSAETAGFLGIDASIAYVTGQSVTQEDYQTVDSPYNTYLHKGLPPGPIANPGMVALNAALNPDSTDDYYYVLGNDGKHHFFKTLKGQQNFIAEQQAAKTAG